jgi:hypothetical protein
MLDIADAHFEAARPSPSPTLTRRVPSLSRKR